MCAVWTEVVAGERWSWTNPQSHHDPAPQSPLIHHHHHLKHHPRRPPLNTLPPSPPIQPPSHHPPLNPTITSRADRTHRIIPPVERVLIRHRRHRRLLVLRVGWELGEVLLGVKLIGVKLIGVKLIGVKLIGVKFRVCVKAVKGRRALFLAPMLPPF